MMVTTCPIASASTPLSKLSEGKRTIRIRMDRDHVVLERAHPPTKECPAGGHAADCPDVRTLGSPPTRIVSILRQNLSASPLRNDPVASRAFWHLVDPNPHNSETESDAGRALAEQSESQQDPDTNPSCTPWSRSQLASPSWPVPMPENRRCYTTQNESSFSERALARGTDSLSTIPPPAERDAPTYASRVCTRKQWST